MCVHFGTFFELWLMIIRPSAGFLWIYRKIKDRCCAKKAFQCYCVGVTGENPVMSCGNVYMWKMCKP